jgi:hypothetical protein
MKRAIAKLGSRAIPGNTKLGYALKAWRKEVVTSLGGPDNITPQQLAIIEMASMNKMMIGSVDAWIMSQPTLITRNRTLIPVVLQRQALVNGFCSMMSQLGLKRVQKPVPTLDEIKREILAEQDDPS